MNFQSSRRKRRLLNWTTAVGICLSSILTPAHAAEEVAFVSGAYRRSISVSDLAHLAETGQPRGLLIDLLKFSKQKPETVSKLLNQKLDLPLVLTSRLMNTRIGEVIIKRIAKIIYPLKVPDPSVSVPALRAGVINGLQIGEGGLSAIRFLEAYPNEVMEVSLPALFSVIEQAESIAGLVKFFSDSPLDGLKDAKR